jgi:hypothetical protein
MHWYVKFSDRSRLPITSPRSLNGPVAFQR